CTLESDPNYTGPSTDPMANDPLPSSTLGQIVPSYYPLQRWIYQRTGSSSPTTLDGRKIVKTTQSNQVPTLCYHGDGTVSTETALLVIQSPNKLLAKKTVVFNGVGDGTTICATAPPQP